LSPHTVTFRTVIDLKLNLLNHLLLSQC
jgi:hypothetical protein